MREQPTPRQWLWVSFKIGVLSFGGSGRILLYQDAVVDEKQWLDEDEFREILTLAQVLPGPNLVNVAAYLGYRLVGAWGAIAGVLLLAVPGALGAIGLIQVLDLKNADVATLFKGFSLGSVAIFMLFIFRLVSGLTNSLVPGQSAAGRKVVARMILAVAIGVGTWVGLPLSWLLVGGITLGFAVEIAP